MAISLIARAVVILLTFLNSLSLSLVHHFEFTRTMPRFGLIRLGDDDQEEETLLEYGQKKTRRIVGGFLDFATQGNILEIAFGLM